MNLIEIKEVRKLVANIYWSLKKDHKALLEQGDDKEDLSVIKILIKLI